MDKSYIQKYILHQQADRNMATIQINPPYTPSDKMMTLITDDFELLQVMSRFGIPVGFGDNTVAEVCSNNNVDCATFLAIVNFVASRYEIIASPADLSIKTLMDYLARSHAYFLDYCLPMIRRKLLDGINLRTSDVSFLIVKFFDDYYNEVRHHMDYEDKNVFQYIDSLLNGCLTGDYTITTYSAKHEQAADKLKELKNLILRYCPADTNINLLNDALCDMYRCERELEGHCLIEDKLLVPAILELERREEKK